MTDTSSYAARKSAHQTPVIAYDGIRKLYGQFVALDGAADGTC